MENDYLLSYGSAGDFGRFRPVRALQCRRGQRAVVRTHRGIELGVVLCEATTGHAQFLPNTSVGQLLRLAGADDERTAESMRVRGQETFESARRLAAELRLPLEVLDAEVLLDGEQAIVHFLRMAPCDERPLVSALSRTHQLHVALHDLALPGAPVAEEEHAGCGRPDCGQGGAGGCTSCGSGGGCSTCGAGKADDGSRAHFAKLRDQMAAQQRTPLL